MNTLINCFWTHIVETWNVIIEMKFENRGVNVLKMLPRKSELEFFSQLC